MSGLGEPAANQARCLSTRAGPWCLSRWSRPVNHVGGSLPPAACTACPISLTYSAAWARVQNAHSIRTVVVDQPRPPLGAILHRADRCRPFQSPSMRFHQRCLRKALGLSQARKGGNLPCADLPAFCARDLPHHQRLDFGPLASYQMHHRSICDSAVAGLLPQAPEAPPARDAPPPPRTPPALLPLLPASLAALSPCSPGSPPDPGGTPALAQTASSSPTAPAFPPRVASCLHSRALTAHPGGKKPTPDFRQVPYVRVSFTASPPFVWMKRVCSPRAESGLSQVAHLGPSSSGCWLHSSVSPLCTTSWINCARSWFIRSSTAASISAHVACGCSLRHSVIPSTPRIPSLTYCICGLHSRFFF